MRTACLACRQQKTKCVRAQDSDTEPCQRCVRLGTPCTVTPRQLGRKKGSKNKYPGLARALRLLESSNASHEQPSTSTSLPLSLLLTKIPQSSSPGPSHCLSNPLGLLAEASDSVRNNNHSSSSIPPSPLFNPPFSSLSSSNSIPSSSNTLPLTLDSLSAASSSLSIRISPDRIFHSLQSFLLPNSPYASLKDDDYFREPSTSIRPDILTQFDPVMQNILTLQDALNLFSIFFKHLQANIGILDPGLHTPDFVRSRSTFLFTAVCSTAAKVYTAPHAAALSERLENHAYSLAGYVMQHGFKSVEIIQAFQIITPWSSPTRSQADDRTRCYISYAISMASEISLDNTDSCAELNNQYPPQPNNSDPLLIQRLKRNRERTWLMLFCWDRGLAATHGRNGTMIEADIIKHLDTWWNHPLAAPEDRQTAGVVAIRDKLSLMQDMLKRRSSEPNPEIMRAIVHNHLEPWRSQWLQEGAEKNIILVLVYHHTCLLLLSFACSGKLSSLDKSSKIFDDCFASAMESCQAAAESLSSQAVLHYAPSNIVVMISYAAIFALKLIANDPTCSPIQRAAYVGLLVYLATQMQQSGTTPLHRNGLSALYGRKLLLIMKNQVEDGLLREKQTKSEVTQPPSKNEATTATTTNTITMKDPITETFEGSTVYNRSTKNEHPPEPPPPVSIVEDQWSLGNSSNEQLLSLPTTSTTTTSQQFSSSPLPSYTNNSNNNNNPFALDMPPLTIPTAVAANPASVWNADFMSILETGIQLLDNRGSFLD